MKKTCMNCKHYYDRMTEEDSNYTIYNWCNIWGCEIPELVIQRRENFTDGYNDLEAGLAICWAFESGRQNEYFPDDRMDYICQERQKLNNKD